MRIASSVGPPQLLPGLIVGAALLLAGGGSPLGAQEPPRFTFHDQISVEWVSVPVVVQSTKISGEPYIADLEADAFSLFVDGEEVPIEDFTRSDRSRLGLVFLQDTSGSMGGGARLERSRGMLRCLLDRLGHQDRATLVTFADAKVRLHIPFTVERESLAAAAERTVGFGNTAIHDALARLPGIARESGTARRAVVLFTDGADNASEIPPQQARELVAGAGLPVFVIDLDPAAGPREPAPSAAVASQQSDRLSLTALATVSGGRYVPLTGASKSALECARITAELRSQYLLGFTTDPAKDAAHHAIEVTVKGKKRRLRYRSSYWGAVPRSLKLDRTLE